MAIGDDIVKVVPSVNYSDYTQKITNVFPEWHVARSQRDSTVAKVVNSAAGAVLEKIALHELPNFITQKRLTLASTHPNEFAFIVDTPIEKNKKDTVHNLALNSRFDVWQNPSRPPDYWNTKVQNSTLLPLFNLIEERPDNYQGGRSLRLRSIADDAVTFGEAVMYQDISIDEDSNETQWTCSLWARSVSSDPFDPTMFKLYVEVYYKDSVNPPRIEEAILETTEWQRYTITTTTNSKIDKIRIGVTFSPITSGDLNIVDITCFFLHPGLSYNFWSNNVEDRPPFVEKTQEGRTVNLSSFSADASVSFYEVGNGEVDSSLLPSHASIEFIPTETIPEITVTPIRIADGYLISGKRVPQNVIIGNAESAAKYGWGTWSYGRIVKFNAFDPTEIYGTFIPSFPIVTGNETDSEFVEAVSSIIMDSMVNINGILWIVARISQGSSLGYMRSTTLILMAVDSQLPKIVNNQDVIDETEKYYTKILYTYYLNDVGYSGSYGEDPYGDTEFGGAVPPDQIRHTSMTVINSNQIETTLEDSYKSVITLKRNFFLDFDSHIVLLRDPREDLSNGEVIVW